MFVGLYLAIAETEPPTCMVGFKALDMRFPIHHACLGFTPRFQEIFRKNQKNPKNGCFKVFLGGLKLALIITRNELRT